MILEGDANDYVGKGMAGGKLVLRPPPGVSYAGQQSVIMGNTCLYGATGGRLYAAGLAGERFAVRNSGARAAVEGVGDHCCEYMTGGMVCVLGPTGLNFGAGMTGGLAFVLDREDAFAERYNRELVETHRVHVEAMEAYFDCLRELIEEMVAETDSPSSRSVLSDLPAMAHKFWLVKPRAVDLETLLSTLRRAA